MARPRTTLVWIAGEQLIRADAGRGGLAVHAIRRPATDELALLVDAALRLGSRPGRTVYVLTDNLWTQCAELPRAAVDGVRGPQLAQALAFEAEPLSGMPAAEAAVAHTQLASEDPLRAHFWLATGSSLELQTTADVVGRLGARLGGLAHPAGVPLPLAQPADAWSRLELWPHAAVRLSGNGSGALDVRLEQGSPLDPDRREELDQWWDQVDDVLVAHGAMRVGDRSAFSLDDESTRDRWLAVWIRALESGAAAPVLRPARRPMSLGSAVAAAIVLWAVVALACWSYHRDLASRRARAEPTAGPPGLARRLALARDDVDRLRAETRRAAPAALTRAQTRAYRVLDVLALNLPSGARITEIVLDGPRLTIRGQVTRAELPNRLAAVLGERLPGWRIAPPTKSLPADGGPWDFTLSLADEGPVAEGKQ